MLNITKKIQKNTAILNQHINRHETGINIKINGPRQNIANISKDEEIQV